MSTKLFCYLVSLFRGKEPEELSIGADVTFLLHTP